VGLFDSTRHLEAELLNLNARHFPLQVSLLPRVMEQFGDVAGPGPGEAALDREQLLDRLRQLDAPAECPLVAVLAMGRARGEPAGPIEEHAALLQWVGAAFDHWERHYPLESELTQSLRRVKPLAAALAVTDTSFLVPGKHPVHRLLDSLQAAAIGWQASLGRAGGGLEQQVDAVVDNILAWFDHPDTDLPAVVTALESHLSKDAERSRKMAGRLVEREQGRQKKAEAAATAACMINAALARFNAPVELGEMLKGPWYDSAQLVLLKYGPDSEQWTQMSKITESVLDSIQQHEEETQERRQHLFRVVTLLPKELRRWLLSLQHDSAGLQDAVGTVEFAHLCMLRQTPLENVAIDPLPLPRRDAPGASERSAEAGVEPGRWYLVRRDGEAPLRARLMLELERERQLLFTNRAGMEIARIDCDEFSALLERGDAIELQRGASFSLSLAAAAGVVSEDDLRALVAASVDPGEQAAKEQAGQATTEEDEQARLWREWEQARNRQLAIEPLPGSEPDAR
jgi:hypothetical protein